MSLMIFLHPRADKQVMSYYINSTQTTMDGIYMLVYLCGPNCQYVRSCDIVLLMCCL